MTKLNSLAGRRLQVLNLTLSHMFSSVPKLSDTDISENTSANEAEEYSLNLTHQGRADYEESMGLLDSGPFVASFERL